MHTIVYHFKKVYMEIIKKDFLLSQQKQGGDKKK